MSSNPTHGAVDAAVINGVDATLVTVEVHRNDGVPTETIVGLPGKAVRESLDRIHGACRSCELVLEPRRTTVNLAPADHPKAGSALDLPIALAMLIADDLVPAERFAGTVCLGELQLDGGLRAVPGVLPAAIAAARAGIRRIVVPVGNGPEAAAIEELGVVAARHLREVVGWAFGEPHLIPVAAPDAPDVAPHADLRNIAGHTVARRALEIAAAGGHHLLMVGVPGAGKTLLARALPGVLPPLSRSESLETSAVYSVSGMLRGRGLLRQRPFRAPHHTVTAVGLIGGRVPPRPGEVSLAHGGVLFLDEFPEFQRAALESLRQPLEEGSVSLVRGGRSVTLPARFQLIAAMNPCPCGKGPTSRSCRCTLGQVRAYWRRVSGPLLDRIDMVVEVDPVDLEELIGVEVAAEPSAAIRERVVAAREVQSDRWRTLATDPVAAATNAALPAKLLTSVCPLTPAQRREAREVAAGLGVSARGWHRILRVARTIADLSGRDALDRTDLAEAFQYRRQGMEMEEMATRLG